MRTPLFSLGIVFFVGVCVGVSVTSFYKDTNYSVLKKGGAVQKTIQSPPTAPIAAARPKQEPLKNSLPLPSAIPPSTAKTKLPETKNQPVEDETHADTFYMVTNVVDGDTLDVDYDGKIERIRPIGVDTPETVDSRKTVQCFGRDASAKATELLLNKKVRIEKDPTQSDRDIYGRLLAYVYREDGLFFNKWMIENGYAHEYTYKTPYAFQKEFKKAQSEARQEEKGLWAPGVCSPS